MPIESCRWTGAELRLAKLAVALGGLETTGPLSSAEEHLVAAAAARPAPPPREVQQAADEILAGGDPLGDRLVSVRPQSQRRILGQVLTPDSISGPMVEWALDRGATRFIDAGCGSGRFTLEIAARSDAQVVSVDTDPLATLLTRAGIAALGSTLRATVLNADFLQMAVPHFDGVTAFIGNPPYVRHHDLPAEVKAWGQSAAEGIGIPLSGLAGLHTYFFLATAIHGRPGDVGSFVTSAEWLDVNYGAVVRRLLLDGLGGHSVQVVDPTALPFAAAATTAAVTCFEVGSRPRSLPMRMVDSAASLLPLGGGRPVPSHQLERAERWGPFVRAATAMPEGHVELGEICRVHRGQVTGSNATWVVPIDGGVPVPERYLLPSVTRARELIDAGERIESTATLRRVIDLPVDLDELDPEERRGVEAFLRSARAAGVADGYIARNRRAWWSVGLREPAPLLATYMARRPPAFVRNTAGVRHINIAHGIYPREPLPDHVLDRLAEAAARNGVALRVGVGTRTAAGRRGTLGRRHGGGHRIQVSSPARHIYVAFLRFRQDGSRAAMRGPCVRGFFVATRLRERVERYI